MGRHCPKAHKIQPVEKQPYKVPLKNYKKKATRIIKEFCLPPDIFKELANMVEKANSEYEVDQVLKKARNYI